MTKATAALVSGLVLAAAAGGLTAGALSSSSSSAAETRTITITNGAPGPPGPRGEPGPPGPSGATACPDGYTAGALVINHPGGQTRIWTCLAN